MFVNQSNIVISRCQVVEELNVTAARFHFVWNKYCLWGNGSGWLVQVVTYSLRRLFLADNASLECSRYWTGTPTRLEDGTCQSTPAPLTVGHMWSVPLFLPLTLPITYYPCHSLCIQHAVPALPLSVPLPLCLFPSKCTVLGSGPVISFSCYTWRSFYDLGVHLRIGNLFMVTAYWCETENRTITQYSLLPISIS